jgi:hypothetical protein
MTSCQAGGTHEYLDSIGTAGLPKKTARSKSQGREMGRYESAG